MDTSLDRSGRDVIIARVRAKFTRSSFAIVLHAEHRDSILGSAVAGWTAAVANRSTILNAVDNMAFWSRKEYGRQSRSSRRIWVLPTRVLPNRTTEILGG